MNTTTSFQYCLARKSSAHTRVLLCGAAKDYIKVDEEEVGEYLTICDGNKHGGLTAYYMVRVVIPSGVRQPSFAFLRPSSESRK